jgi:uncharacterized protein (TIGR02646 family)
LSKKTVDFLWARRLRIVDAGDRAARQSERKAAQYAEAHALWEGSYKKNKAFDEIRSTLRGMAPGHEFCMYCEHNHGNAIDHFCPVEKDPTRAFSWDNYLWSCSICNTDFKGTQFPVDRNGVPLLINPTRDDPREHLSFAPRSGKLLGRTPRGAKTIEILGFDRRGNLDKTRSLAWSAVQRCLVSYDEARRASDMVRASEVERDLRKQQHASLLAMLIEVLEKPGGALLVTETRCSAILAAYPEVRGWV